MEDNSMALIRFKRPVSFVNAYGLIYGCSRFNPKRIEAGEVFEEWPTIGYGVSFEDVEELVDPRDEGPPDTIAVVLSELDRLLEWIRAGQVATQDGLFRRVVVQRLRQLMAAYIMMANTPPLSFDERYIDSAQDMPFLVNLVKSFRQEIAIWCKEVAGQREDAGESRNPRRRRGRPPGSATAAIDHKLYHDWKAAHRATGIMKAEFLRERGLPESDLAAIERGRAQERRRRGRK
jgi:hypothetical protein